MARTVKVVFVLLFVLGFSNGARLYMEKCDESRGFKCVITPWKKHDVIFTCNIRSSWDVEFFLWSFRSISTISSFTIANCTNVTLNLQCTNENKFINYLRIQNVSKLTITYLHHGLMQSPPKIFLEDIGYIERIYSRTFIQIKNFPYSRYGCISPQNLDLESIHFKNVNIGVLEKESFHNLTNFKNFIFENVSIDEIEPNAAKLFMDKNQGVTIKLSNFPYMEYLSFYVRGHYFTFESNTVGIMETRSIKSSVYNFRFVKNTVGSLKPGSMSVLAQNVKISESNFDYLSEGALKTIEPGLPLNALVGFGDLHFTFEFKNNLVESLEVGSLHPDWRAYKKVGGILTIKYNVLKCTCAELAWLSIKEGFGKEFSSLDEYHEKILNVDNKNICLDSPCALPVSIVRTMVIKDGRCYHNYTPEELCDIYYPTTTQATTIKLELPKPNITPAPNVQYLKRLRYGSYKAGGNKVQFMPLIIFVIVICKIFT